MSSDISRTSRRRRPLENGRHEVAIIFCRIENLSQKWGCFYADGKLRPVKGLQKQEEQVLGFNQGIVLIKHFRQHLAARPMGGR